MTDDIFGDDETDPTHSIASATTYDASTLPDFDGAYCVVIDATAATLAREVEC